jgi:hypothetical protein
VSLRAVKPTEIQKRLKLFMWGAAGSGKTTAAIRWPRPYFIDCERGAENESYVKALTESGGVYFATADFDDVLAEVKSLLAEKHEYQTLVIDPFTVIYNELVDKSARGLAEASGGKSDGTEFGRHRALADRKIKRLLNLILRLDMNVVMTSHQKPKWERTGDSVKEVGNTFDCYPKLDYLFDLVLEIQVRGGDRVAVVRKTRLAPFPPDDVFPLDYGEIASRYGHGVLERAAVPVELATPEQVELITHLVGVLVISEEVQDKWLTKAQADTFDELPRAAADKIIEMLNARLDPKARGED